MRLFLLHILVKDCSFSLLYFLTLRFNLTGETFLPEMKNNFPEAWKMSAADMLVASFFISMLPMLISGLAYLILYVILDKPFERRDRFTSLCIGFLLAFTFPVVALAGGVDLIGTKAGIYALCFSVVISVTTYYALNARSGRTRTNRNTQANTHHHP